MGRASFLSLLQVELRNVCCNSTRLTVCCCATSYWPKGGIRSLPLDTHISAAKSPRSVLLLALHNTGVVVKPDLEALLAALTEKQLRRVLQALAEGRPELVDDIEREVQWLI